VQCADERDELSRMEQRDSRDDRDSVAHQRKLVADMCPAVPTANVWLVAASFR